MEFHIPTHKLQLHSRDSAHDLDVKLRVPCMCIVIVYSCPDCQQTGTNPADIHDLCAMT